MSLSSSDTNSGPRPLLSVITTAYNAEPYIAETIESVIALGDSYEHIVIDDGSKDKTASIVEAYGDKVRLVKQENRGKSTSRNRGLEMSTGEFVLFLDADDMALKNMLDDLREAIAAQPEGDVFYADHYLSDEHGNITSLFKVDNLDQDPLRTLVIRNRLGIMATICRASVVKSIQGFDLNFPSSEDWELWIRLAASGAKFRKIENPIAIYRNVPGSNSKIFGRVWISLMRLQKKHGNMIREMRDGKQILLGQIDHMLDRDLKYVYGNDLEQSWLKRRVKRTLTVFSLCRKYPSAFPSFFRRFIWKMARIKPKPISS